MEEIVEHLQSGFEAAQSRADVMALLKRLKIQELTEELKQQSQACRAQPLAVWSLGGHWRRQGLDNTTERNTLCLCPELMIMILKTVRTFAMRTHGHHFRESSSSFLTPLSHQACAERVIPKEGEPTAPQ